uniref:DRBM domain-containing protein n=1 Tax=Chenopodium quinoa TaxID=63459 RepID=A0A803MHI4_CHEQI
MFKNQLQELAQRSCFNLPSYACRREGPDHAPRFKASVNFNGEIFESPGYSPTLRQAEHAAAEVALNLLSSRGSKSLTARVLDETGVYKNLLQETAHKAGLNLPVYTTIRTGPGHVPVFTCTVELAGMSFTGESAKTKKQAEKNAAISAWSTLKRMPSLFPKIETAENNNLGVGKQDQVIVARQKSSSFVDLLPPPPPRTMSKILPLTLKTSTTNVNLNEGDHVCHGKLNGVVRSTISTTQQQGETHYRNLFLGSSLSCAQMGIMGNYNSNLKGIAPAVQIRSVIPVCAAPPVKPLIKEDESSSSAAVISPPESSQQLSTSLSSEVSKLQLKEE